jgi:hypothetical protein
MLAAWFGRHLGISLSVPAGTGQVHAGIFECHCVARWRFRILLGVGPDVEAWVAVDVHRDQPPRRPPQGGTAGVEMGPTPGKKHWRASRGSGNGVAPGSLLTRAESIAVSKSANGSLAAATAENGVKVTRLERMHAMSTVISSMTAKAEDPAPAVRDNERRALFPEPAELTAPDVLIPPKGPIPEAQQEDHPRSREEPHEEEPEKHSLLCWTALAPGDLVSLKVTRSGACVGTVESKTNDGLIIWLRDNLNQRKLFHFHDCQSVRLLSDDQNG